MSPVRFLVAPRKREYHESDALFFYCCPANGFNRLLTTINIPNYRDGVYSGDNLTFTVDGEPRTVNSVTISSRQVGNDTLYSDNLKKHYLSPIYVTNVIIKGFPGKKDRITIPAISSVDKLRGCINIYPEYYDCFGKFTGSILDRHEFQGLELQLISR